MSLSLALCFRQASSGLHAGPVGNLFVSPISGKLRKTCTDLKESHNQTRDGEHFEMTYHWTIGSLAVQFGHGSIWFDWLDPVAVSRHQGQISPLTLTARD